MAEAEVRDETEMTDHDLLIQVAVIALGADVTGEEILECISNLGRQDLIDQARQTRLLMEATDEPGVGEEPPVTEPPPEGQPTDAP